MRRCVRACVLACVCVWLRGFVHASAWACERLRVCIFTRARFYVLVGVCVPVRARVWLG